MIWKDWFRAGAVSRHLKGWIKILAMRGRFENITFMAAKKAKTKGKRYSDEEKAEIIRFVEAQGRGGGAAAAKKYGVSPLSISKWKQEFGG